MPERLRYSYMKHRYHTHLVVALSICALATAVSPSPVLAQLATPTAEFEAEAVCTMAQSSDERTRVDIYTKVPFASVGFSTSPQGFVGRYQVSAEVFEVDQGGIIGNRVENPVWDRTVRVANHAETTDKERFDLTTHTLFLRPGRYHVELSLSDDKSGDATVRELPILVRDLQRPVAISDLLLLEDFDADKNIVTPVVSNRLASDQLGFALMYEVYVQQPRSVRISQEVYQTSNSLPDQDGVAAEPVTSEALFSNRDTKFLEATRTQHVVTIPIADLRLGQYLVRVTVEDEAGTRLDAAETAFTVDWMGLSDHIEDLDEAIAQLLYIADRKEIRHLRESKSQAEKLARFREFWQRRDPTPGTRRNERMEEYYYRVSHANKRFASLIDDGWKTDRGQVVVTFGEPDYIERHPFNFNVKPYEVWYYYRIGRRFIFVDKTGLGDYQLLVPMWDERTRIR